MQTTLQLLYKTVSGSKKKERFETILEPLQALIQIALLSYFPIGSKLTIQNNILHIQAPSYTQSVTRWYNNDTQEDLFYLFNIFCRFKKFYTDIKVEHAKLFELLIYLAKNGINNLIRTYNQTDKTHVLHTLQMYKNMLDGANHSYTHVAAAAISINMNPVPESNHFISSSSTSSTPSPNAAEHSLHDKIIKTNRNNNFHEKKNKIARTETDNVLNITSSSSNSISLESENEKQLNKKEMNSVYMTSLTSTPTPTSPSPDVDMDTIFIKITDLYSDEIFRIIYSTFIEIERDDTNYIDYANGLNIMLHPINIRIKKWIDENIVF
jgi:hypothetical protein